MSFFLRVFIGNKQERPESSIKDEILELQTIRISQKIDQIISQQELTIGVTTERQKGISARKNSELGDLEHLKEDDYIIDELTKQIKIVQ